MGFNSGFKGLIVSNCINRGPAVAQLVEALRYKPEGRGFYSNSIRIFHLHNPSGRTMALGLTQPLTEMSTRNTSWGVKGGRCVGLTTLPPSCADCPEIWEPQTSGTLRVCLGLQWDCFTFLSLILKFWQWADFHETLYERYTTRGLHFLNSLITKWWTRERH